ncbi:hypothetical protein GCM10009623_36280 [Nocardioides aestuarii]|uniref:RNA polymerase sigma factor n=1 Tax=Nocardioides aestuarii TaxID=252231 RepID=A0ABW4TRA2_9ACTN
MARDRSTDDRDFGDWLAARWPTLVRTLLLLGLGRADSRAVAFATVVAARPDFARLHREEDVDVAVQRELHHELTRHRRRHPEQPWVDPAPDGDAGPEAVERLEEVCAALAALSAGQREVVVLRQVAGLADDQVADVLDRVPEQAPLLPDPDVLLALSALHVDLLPVAEVASAVRALRARVVRRALVVTVALLLVVAGVAWWLRPGDDGIGEVVEAENPLPLAWYGNGRLHLDDVVVTVPAVVDLVSVPGGAVMADQEGVVTLVGDEGGTTRLGRTVPGDGLVAEPDNGWVAWADPGAGDPELVVFDTRVGEEVGRRSLASPGEGGGQPVAGSGPVAVDGERVYYAARGNDYVWEPLRGDAFALEGSLADVAGGARLSSFAEGYLLQAGAYRRGTPVAGSEGRLTADGRYLFVRDSVEEVRVYETSTGRRLPRMYSPSDAPVSWAYSEDGRFWFAVEHDLQDKTYQDTLQMPSRGNYRIYECVPGRSDVCIDRAEVAEDAPEPPVLAH